MRYDNHFDITYCQESVSGLFKLGFLWKVDGMRRGQSQGTCGGEHMDVDRFPYFPAHHEVGVNR